MWSPLPPPHLTLEILNTTCEVRSSRGRTILQLDELLLRLRWSGPSGVPACPALPTHLYAVLLSVSISALRTFHSSRIVQCLRSLGVWPPLACPPFPSLSPDCITAWVVFTLFPNLWVKPRGYSDLGSIVLWAPADRWIWVTLINLG